MIQSRRGFSAALAMMDDGRNFSATVRLSLVSSAL
jgi:hypothetical protein